MKCLLCYRQDVENAFSSSLLASLKLRRKCSRREIHVHYTDKRKFRTESIQISEHVGLKANSDIFQSGVIPWYQFFQGGITLWASLNIPKPFSEPVPLSAGCDNKLCQNQLLPIVKISIQIRLRGTSPEASAHCFLNERSAWFSLGSLRATLASTEIVCLSMANLIWKAFNKLFSFIFFFWHKWGK